MTKRLVLNTILITLTLGIAFAAVFFLTDIFKPKLKNESQSQNQGQSSPQTQTVTEATLEEAKQLTSDCKVKYIYLSHTDGASIGLVDGSVKNIYSSEIAELLNLAEDASAKCGFQITKIVQ